MERIFARFGMENCAPISTPMEPKQPLVKNTTEGDPELRTKFQSLIGAVLYLSRMTRPDISYSVAALSRHCSNPSPEHWVAAKRLPRYIEAAASLGFNISLPKAQKILISLDTQMLYLRHVWSPENLTRVTSLWQLVAPS